MLILHLSIVLLLIIVNSVFAMAEIALVSARKARLVPLAEAGNRGAQAALELKADPSRLLSTVQIGVTLIAVLSGTFGEATWATNCERRARDLSRVRRAIRPRDQHGGRRDRHLVFLADPRRARAQSASRCSTPSGSPLRSPASCGRLPGSGAPIEWFLSASTDLVLRLLPVRSQGAAPVTDEEISFMLREGVATGHIPQAETAIVEMALRLGDRRASAVMTPRTQIEWLDLDDSEEDNRRKIRESNYSRFPVVQGGSQQVIGIVQAKDLLAACLAGQPLDLRAATRPPLYLPNTVTVLRVLEVFKTSGEPMALIVDEYGDLEGLVTPSDILETLVGDIPGSPEADQRIVRRDDETWLIDGMVGLDELKQVLGISRLPGEDPDFHTLGGYLMARLNRVPMEADRITAGDWRFEVVKMDGRRVDRVLVTPVKGRSRR